MCVCEREREREREREKKRGGSEGLENEKSYPVSKRGQIESFFFFAKQMNVKKDKKGKKVKHLFWFVR